MKIMFLIFLLNILVLAGFFNESRMEDKAEYLENTRLCNIFTKKVEDYKKNMRQDFLAGATLASYEYRANLFCKKATNAKKALEADTLPDINITIERNSSNS